MSSSKKLTEMILTANRLSAQEAYQRGLVNKLVPTREELVPGGRRDCRQDSGEPAARRSHRGAARQNVCTAVGRHSDAAVILRNCGCELGATRRA